MLTREVPQSHANPVVQDILTILFGTIVGVVLGTAVTVCMYFGMELSGAFEPEAKAAVIDIKADPTPPIRWVDPNIGYWGYNDGSSQYRTLRFVDAPQGRWYGGMDVAKELRALKRRLK